jgi:hypothetical protein
MSKTEQQRMYEIGTIILSCAISWRMTSYDYGLRQIFLHIKANELLGSEMGLTKQYYDNKCNKFIFVMKEMEDWNNAEQLVLVGHRFAWHIRVLSFFFLTRASDKEKNGILYIFFLVAARREPIYITAKKNRYSSIEKTNEKKTHTFGQNHARRVVWAFVHHRHHPSLYLSQ